MIINNNIKFCREEIEMTQKELGDELGVSNFTVHGWENGHDSIPLTKLIKFCNLYKYSVDFVLGLSKNKIKYNKNIDTDKNKIGNKLNEIRNNLKYNKTKFAENCNLDRSTYSRYERGKYLINVFSLYSICLTYNISADWILGRTEIKELKN